MSFSRTSTPSRTAPTYSNSSHMMKSTIKHGSFTPQPSSTRSTVPPKSAYKELDQYIQRYEETAYQHTDPSLADIKLSNSSRLGRSKGSIHTPLRSTGRSKSPIYSHQRPPVRMEQPHHPLQHKASPMSISEPFTPYYQREFDHGLDAYESIENSIQHFLTSLEKHQKHRTHQLRQIQQFLQADLEWENEFGESMIQANMNSHELTDEEFQAYLLGELPEGGGDTEILAAGVAESEMPPMASSGANNGISCNNGGGAEPAALQPDYNSNNTSFKSLNNSALRSVDLDDAMDLSIARNDKKTHLRLLTRNIGDLLQQMTEAQSAATLQPIVSEYAKESIQSIPHYQRQSVEKDIRQTPIKVSWDEYNIAQSSKKENLPFNRIPSTATSSSSMDSKPKRWEDIASDEPFSTKPPQPPGAREEKEMQILRPKHVTPVKDISKAAQRYTSDSDSDNSGYSHRQNNNNRKNNGQDPMRKYLKAASKESREWLSSAHDLRQISKIDKLSEDEELDLFSIAKGGLELAYDVDFTLGSKTPEPKTPKMQPKFT